MQSVDSPELPVLYSFRRCPYAMRARLALAVSSVQIELREVTLRNKPAEMLSVSPKATVPVLVLPDGRVVDESLGIMLWALRQSDPESWLRPQRGSVTDMLALIAANDGAFKQHLDRYKYPNRYPQESGGDVAEFANVHRADAARWLRELELMLDSVLKGGWLFGSAPSLADMALLPFVRQFAHTDAAWFAAQPWPRLQGWLVGFEGSDLFLGVMGKHTAWVSGLGECY
ncbi:MAG: glutathione S-transferase [Vitreoscilla sp.]|nr:glutathione S-transferase [Polaromonas sp.]